MLLICALFGHSVIYDKKIVKGQLSIVLEDYIKNGLKKILIATHGEFDDLALSVCRELRKKYKIEIEVIFTSQHYFKKDEFGYSRADYYNDVSTSSYFIEEEYYKNRITASNKHMVEDSDLVICYVDENRYRSGAKNAIKYASKLGKKVINIYNQCNELIDN